MLISNLNRWERRTFGFMVFDGEGNNNPPGSTNPPNDKGNPPPSEPKKVQFDAEQMAHVQSLIEADRANRKPEPADTKAADDLAKVLKAHGFKSLDDALKPKKPNDERPAGQFTQEDMDRVKTETDNGWKTRYDSLESTHTGLLSSLAEKEIESAAIDAKILKEARKDVAALLRNAVKWNADTNSFVVVDSDGKPRINFQTAKPMTVTELVTEYGASRPHLVEGANTSGGGSGTSKQTPDGKKIYNREQLKDAAFYDANRDDILKAYAEGRIK